MAPTAPHATERETVDFILDGETVTLRDVHPTRTVLEYLREDRRRTGTKEGCAEGDCGACTVVLAEPSTDAGSGVRRLRVRAVNACIQFLPALDGTALFTVESLHGAGTDLHPVAQAMVEQHGSQCGFCTPGFVMSLFALFKSNPRIDRAAIDDALAGNLCRCTGYRPIVAAAEAMRGLAGAPGDPRRDWMNTPAGEDEVPGPEETGLIARLDRLRATRSARVAGAPGPVARPRTVAELTAVLAEHPDARIVAGSTDVGLWVTKQLRDLGPVVFIGGVDELRTVAVGASHIEIGAGVTLSEAMPVLTARYPDLDELLRRFASPPIRNAATLGGNIANGSPIGDSMPALIALATTLVLHGAGGTREVPLDEFYLAYQKTALGPGEFLARIRIPLPTPDLRLRSYKISKRFDQDISAVCAAFALRLDGDTVTGARVAFGGMAATPRRAPACESALRGATWNEPSVRRAMGALGRDYAPIDDMRASARYRARVAANLLYRCYLETGGTTEPARVAAGGARR